MSRRSPLHDSSSWMPHKPRIGPRTPPGSPPKSPESVELYPKIYHYPNGFRSATSPSRGSISSEYDVVDHFTYSQMNQHPYIRSRSPYSPTRTPISSESDEDTFRSRTIASPSKVSVNSDNFLWASDAMPSVTPSSPSPVSLSIERDNFDPSLYHPMVTNCCIKASPFRVSKSSERDEVALNPNSRLSYDAIKSKTPSSPPKVSFSTERNKVDHKTYSSTVENSRIKSSSLRVSKSSEHDKAHLQSNILWASNAMTSVTPSSPFPVSLSTERDNIDPSPYHSMVPKCLIRSIPLRVSKSSERDEVAHNLHSPLAYDAIKSKTPSSPPKVSFSTERNKVDHKTYTSVVQNSRIKSSSLKVLKSSEHDKVRLQSNSLRASNTMTSVTPSSPPKVSFSTERNKVDHKTYTSVVQNSRIKSSSLKVLKSSEHDKVRLQSNSLRASNTMTSVTPSSPPKVSFSTKRNKVDHKTYSSMVQNSRIKSSPLRVSKSSERDEVAHNLHSPLAYDAIKSKTPSSPPKVSFRTEHAKVDHNPNSRLAHDTIKPRTPSSTSRITISSESDEVDHDSQPQLIHNPRIKSKTPSISSRVSISSESDEADHNSYPRVTSNPRIRSRTSSITSRISISSECSEVDQDSYFQMIRKRRHRIKISPSSSYRMSRSSERNNKFYRRSSPRGSHKKHRRARSPKRKVIIQDSSFRSSRDRHRILDRCNNEVSNNKRSPKRSRHRSRSPSSFRYSQHAETMSRRSHSQSYSTDHNHYPHELYHRPHLSDRIYDRLLLHPPEMITSGRPILSYATSTYTYYNSICTTIRSRQNFPLNPCYSPYSLYNYKDKYPDYLYHIRPEDDPLATRTLFVGNLEISITVEHLHYVFGQYGIVEDIDLKKPLPDTGNAYAFVRYKNLDMAFVAKVRLSGQYLGKLLCKIGYGKIVPTKRVWVGGLDNWTSLRKLEQVFSRFGVIKEMQYAENERCAYITFESTDAAKAAVMEMRGVHLNNPLYRLKTDFADEELCTTPKSKSTNDDLPVGDNHPSTSDHKEPAENGDECKNTTNFSPSLIQSTSVKDITKESSDPSAPFQQVNSNNLDTKEDSLQATDSSNLALTLDFLVEECVNVWQGTIVLKESLYLAKYHLLFGDPKMIKKMAKDNDNDYILRIDQQFRLIKINENQPQEIHDVITTAKNKILFKIIPCPANPNIDLAESNSSWNLGCLIKYLTLTSTTGVVPVLEDIETSIYIFPPCEFAVRLVKQISDNWPWLTHMQDYLVVVIITKSKDVISDTINT